MTAQSIGRQGRDSPSELWFDPDGPILVEGERLAASVRDAGGDARVVVVRTAEQLVGEGRFVVASRADAIVRAHDAGLPVLDARGRDDETVALAVEWVTDRLSRATASLSADEWAEVERRSWLRKVRSEERRLQQRHLEIVARERRGEAERRREAARAEEERLRSVRQLEEHVALRDRHIEAIEASRAWQVAMLLQRSARRVARRPDADLGIDDPLSPPPANDPVSVLDAGPTTTSIELKGEPTSPLPAVDLAAARAVAASLLEGHPELPCTVWELDPNGGPRAVGEAPYLAVLDPDADLVPSGLVEALRAMEDEGWDAVLTDERVSDPATTGSQELRRGAWSPTAARSWALASGLVVLRRSFVDANGGFRVAAGWDGPHDLLLRSPGATIGRVGAAGCVRRGPLGPLRRRRQIAGVLAADLARRGEPADLEAVEGLPGGFRARRRLARRPRVSVVVPTRDAPELLEMVLDGLAATSWAPLEVILVDNGTTDSRARAILSRTPHRVLKAAIPFNFPRLVNRGAAAASGEVLVLLNNDIEVRDPHWVEALLDHVLEPDVGPVGALLRYPDATIQHCGMAIEDGIPVHPLRGLETEEAPAHLVRVPGNRTGVTAACMAIRTDVFWRLDGMEQLLERDYNDVDLCLRAAAVGLRTVYTPFAELVHHESATRGREFGPDVGADWLLFRSRWAATLAGPDRWWPPRAS